MLIILEVSQHWYETVLTLFDMGFFWTVSHEGGGGEAWGPQS